MKIPKDYPSLENFNDNLEQEIRNHSTLTWEPLERVTHGGAVTKDMLLQPSKVIVDFEKTLMQGMLSFLLFAGALHVDINDLISHHEEQLANPLLEYINSRDDIRLIGKKKIKNRNRAPTIAFTFNNQSSKNISNRLVKNGIATRNDNFYAWRCLLALGIDVDDGVVRTSMVHYNSHDDVEKLINALKKINS